MTTRTASSAAAATPGRSDLLRRVGKGAPYTAHQQTTRHMRAVPTRPRKWWARRVQAASSLDSAAYCAFAHPTRLHSDGMIFSAGNQVPKSVGGQGTAMNTSKAI